MHEGLSKYSKIRVNFLLLLLGPTVDSVRSLGHNQLLQETMKLATDEKPKCNRGRREMVGFIKQQVGRWIKGDVYQINLDDEKVMKHLASKLELPQAVKSRRQRREKRMKDSKEDRAALRLAQASTEVETSNSGQQLDDVSEPTKREIREGGFTCSDDTDVENQDATVSAVVASKSYFDQESLCTDLDEFRSTSDQSDDEDESGGVSIGVVPGEEKGDGGLRRLLAGCGMLGPGDMDGSGDRLVDFFRETD